MSHPLDQFIAQHRERETSLMLTPVLCTDCGQYVPLGWVEYGTVRCEKNVGAGGVQYGHRTSSEVVTNIKDTLYNHLSDTGQVEKRAAAEIVRLSGKRGYGYILTNAMTGEVVEASSPNVFLTRGKAVAESRNRARALGFGHIDTDSGKTTVFTADQFTARISQDA